MKSQATRATPSRVQARIRRQRRCCGLATSHVQAFAEDHPLADGVVGAIALAGIFGALIALWGAA